ncbi:MAG: histidinol-phosphate transaminase [Nitriliruptor sp.]|nr:MAG: histidinol-phosphate transaminase [Nitriliruptor sp.]
MTSPTPTTGVSRVPVRPDLASVEPYGAPQLDVSVRLNTNETAEPPPPGFLEEVGRRIQGLELNRYPDRPHQRLREALAGRLQTTAEHVWAANGSNEILQQLLQAYGGPDRLALYVRPGYSMYPELCRTSLTPTAQVDLDDAFELSADVAAAAVAQHDPDIVMVPSPNNPVGTPVAHDALRALHDGSRALIVVDEAYIEFADDHVSALPLLAELPRLVIVRTMSKAFRLAGLRLGYLVGPSWVVEDVQKVRLPYHLDAIKQVAALVAIEQEAAFLEHRERLAAERDRVAAALRGHDTLQVFPSAANFVLVRSAVPDLFGRLLEHGVLVRDFSDKPRLAGCVRVTIGTGAENDAFLAALDEVLASA